MSHTPTQSGNKTLSYMLATAMFILVVDTSFMNVSISSVVESLDTSVSDVQGVIALEALISAAFILISSKLGDIWGRKLAFRLGLIAYGAGALSVALATNIRTVTIFWAIFGGLGASLLLPAMQSLIHGNFKGAAQKKTFALVGAASAIAAAIGPLIGGFVTTFLSYRFAFILEFIIVVVVLIGTRLIKDVPYTGDRKIDYTGAALSVIGMSGVVLGILAWQEGRNYVGLFIGLGIIALILLARWLIRRKKSNLPVLLDPSLFAFQHFRLGFTGQMMQNIILGGSMIALPIFLQMSLEYNALQTGLTIAPLSLSMFAIALYAGKKLTVYRNSRVIKWGYSLCIIGIATLIPVIFNAVSGLVLGLPLIILGSGLGLLVSQLNNYTLAPIGEQRVSEAAGINSAAGSFGLSFGLAVAGGVLLANLTYSFTNLSNKSSVIPDNEKTKIAAQLQSSAEVISNSDLRSNIQNQPENVQTEVLNINTQATRRSLQTAMIIPLIASGIGFIISRKMETLPDIKTHSDQNSLVT